MTDRDLDALERRTFRAATDDGLADVLIAGFVAMFAIAPLLSDRLGDFWSTAVFVPIWIGVYVITRVIRTNIVVPHLGMVTPGRRRVQRTTTLRIALLVVDAVALAAGIGVAAAVATDRLDPEGLAYPIALAVAFLIGFSLGAYWTSVVRFAFYGLMLGAAPLVGEWLWRHDLAADHGYPVAFGVAAGLIFTVGVVRCIVLVRAHPVPPSAALM